MTQAASSCQIRKPVNYAKIVEREVTAVRKAWRLTPPMPYDHDPRWLKRLALAAAGSGRLPKQSAYDTVIGQLHRAGYHDIIDHYGIVIENGQRHVIFEPYESRCHMDKARRIADELATKLQCRSWVSLRSWHIPGATVRITLAPPATDPTQGYPLPPCQNTRQ